MLNIKTEINTISDHCNISSTFNIQIPKQQPKYRRIRNFKLVNRESLVEALKVNPNIQQVFHHSEPNIIAEIIMDNLNQIIDVLAPLRIVPIKKDFRNVMRSQPSLFAKVLKISLPMF